MTHKDELIHRLGAMLVSDPEVACGDWQHIALVATFDESSSSVTGFCYQAGGAYEPAAPYDLTTLDVLRDLRGAIAAEGGQPWRACLIRIARATGKLDIQFEYDAPERWRISFANRLERLRELAPPGWGAGREP